MNCNNYTTFKPVPHREDAKDAKIKIKTEKNTFIKFASRFLRLCGTFKSSLLTGKV